MLEQERLEQRRAELVAERQALLEQANRQLALLDGALAMIDELLAGSAEETEA